jgi:uncharacterized NAD(P)/FAD-binding protein YdhS
MTAAVINTTAATHLKILEFDMILISVIYLE